MIKVSWDVEEFVALIDIYRKSTDKSSTEIIEALSKLSVALRKRAEVLGIPHDEKYRNLNGLKIMYQNVRYIATNGQCGMSSTSLSMRKVYGLLATAPEVFDLIQKEFEERYY